MFLSLMKVAEEKIKNYVTYRQSVPMMEPEYE
jgi:hypothetical protein